MPGREEFKREYLESIAETCSKPFAECSRLARYTALAAMIRECCSGVRAETLRRRAAAGEARSGESGAGPRGTGPGAVKQQVGGRT